MAAIRYKELLGWYVITLKSRETVESRLPKKSTYGSKIVPDYEPRPSKSEWVISIEKKHAQGRQENMLGSWANLSIYRIPRYLKNGEDKAWVPQIVSLGPYHHGEEHLRHMDRHKWRCLHRILERSGQGIGLYLDSVKKVVRRACACYEGRISMSRDEFVEMMVLDGCFVIEMFQGFAEGFKKLGYLPNDPVFSMRESILQIQRDMIMLENQVPLFILDRLLGLQLGDLNQKECVTKLALQFFSPLIGIPQNVVFMIDPKDPESKVLLVELEETMHPDELEETMHPIDKDSCKGLKFDPFYNHREVHCLELVRRSLLHLGLKRPKTEKWPQSRSQLTFRLRKLREAGIQIKRRYSNSWGDIHFKNGILRIPPIEIHEGTRSLFLNLIAFEQSHFNCSHYVTSYVIFMHNLINSPEDVQYLCKRGIIKHCLGSDAEVADLFHQLCQEVAFDIRDSYLIDLSGELNYYCIRSWSSWRDALSLKWNAWRTILKSKYFDNPWSIISVIAAVVLLVLTFTQTFYGVYGYYRPRS
ncbi:UPF0481 protein At3g47200-like [Eucalyptus grandis]|uniref:UPF0481 protein At3g47200-like n=1 Tax=Eucalyptus grandis TaxID=71139 RepID=UPI00192EC605|nr:UPF0481 protein At3g47200-like [Eucalyptus grandis]